MSKQLLNPVSESIQSSRLVEFVLKGNSMKDVFYFGARLRVSLAKSFLAAGHTIIHQPHRQGLQELQRGNSPCAVVIHWRSTRDQRAIEKAKALGIPVLAITSKLVAATKEAPFADAYLEVPASDQEIVAFILDMIAATKPLKRTAAAVGAGIQPSCG